MEITNNELVNGMQVYTVKVANKLIQTSKFLEIINNLEDYIDAKGIIDKESIKADVLEEREYLVRLNDPHANPHSCSCKGYYFTKKNCKHISFILKQLENEKNI